MRDSPLLIDDHEVNDCKKNGERLTSSSASTSSTSTCSVSALVLITPLIIMRIVRMVSMMSIVTIFCDDNDELPSEYFWNISVRLKVGTWF